MLKNRCKTGYIKIFIEFLIFTIVYTDKFDYMCRNYYVLNKILKMIAVTMVEWLNI